MEEKRKAKPWVFRPIPRYRTIVAITDVACRYDYPKNKDKCVWGIAGKFKKKPNREIAALVCVWLCDWTTKSIEASRKVVSWLGDNPYAYIMKKEYNYMIMQCDQSEVIYKTIKRSDCWYFFEWIHGIVSRYGSFFYAMNMTGKPNHYDAAYELLKSIKGFKGRTTEAEAKINLFFYMMAHCFDDYQIDSSKLRPPLFKHHIIHTCKALFLLSKDDKKDAYVDKVTDYLKWFSENHPMTFWTGIAMYNTFSKEYPKEFRKFAKKYKVTKHIYRKRY